MPPRAPTSSRSGSTRTSSALALLIGLGGAAALAQPPPPRGPQGVAARVRIHVRVHEDLKPDLLRGLALPGVTAWVDTRSNTLKASAVEHLARFDDVFVRVRLPLKAVDAAAFSKVPRAGLWVALKDANRAALSRVPGGRRVAVDVDGPLDDAAVATLRALRPAWIRWAPPTPPSVLEWSQLAQLGGRRVVVLPQGGALPGDCAPDEPAPAAELPLAQVLEPAETPAPCTRGALVRVPLDASAEALEALVVRHPGAEILLVVGADEDAARAARRALGRLGLEGRR